MIYLSTQALAWSVVAVLLFFTVVAPDVLVSGANAVARRRQVVLALAAGAMLFLAAGTWAEVFPPFEPLAVEAPPLAINQPLTIEEGFGDPPPEIEWCNPDHETPCDEGFIIGPGYCCWPSRRFCIGIVFCSNGGE